MSRTNSPAGLRTPMSATCFCPQPDRDAAGAIFRCCFSPEKSACEAGGSPGVLESSSRNRTSIAGGVTPAQPASGRQPALRAQAAGWISDISEPAVVRPNPTTAIRYFRPEASREASTGLHCAATPALADGLCEKMALRASGGRAVAPRPLLRCPMEMEKSHGCGTRLG